MKFSPEPLSPKAEKKKKISEEKMSEEVVFVEKEGVAHVGPEFVGIKSEDIKKTNPETKDYEEKSELVFQKEKTSEKLLKFFRKKTKRKENLKTMPESKKERYERGETREALHDPKRWDETGVRLGSLDTLGEE
ncbi:hypothetical protein KKA39_01905 [Patescibacteria group bacterium]|nr:hypothetical protein [Patescibacteria group bacterium]